MKRIGTSTVNVEIRINLQKELELFGEQINDFLSGKSKFMPLHNTDVILKKYIDLSINELQRNGLDRVRARSISKHTLKELLEETMNRVNL